MTIVEFLTARLDEAESGWKTQKRSEDEGVTEALFHFGHRLADEMLADVAAKRAIIARYEAWDMGADDGSTVTAILLGVVQTLTSVYSDHSDYRQEWKP